MLVTLNACVISNTLTFYSDTQFTITEHSNWLSFWFVQNTSVLFHVHHSIRIWFASIFLYLQWLVAVFGSLWLRNRNEMLSNKKKNEKVKKKFGMCSLPVFLWFLSVQLGVYLKNKVSLSNAVLIHHFPVALTTTTTISKCQSIFCFHPFVYVCRSVVHGLDPILFFSFILIRSRLQLRYKIHFSNVYLFLQLALPKD